MATYDSEIADANTRELETILHCWYANRDSDSVTFQNIRRNEMSIARHLMKDLVYGVQPERYLELTVGRNPIEGVIFTRDAYDFLTPHHRTLDPDSKVTLERTVGMHDIYNPEHAGIYVGRVAMVGLGAMAQTIGEEGGLAIVEAMAPSAVSLSGR